MLFKVFGPIASSRTLAKVALCAGGVGLYSLLPVAKEYSRFRNVADTPPEFHAALTLVLGWLLVFRTNTAHARWWEARTLWGLLVNVSRTLSIKVARVAQLPQDVRDRTRRILIAFPLVLRDHLRGESSLERVTELTGECCVQVHGPTALVTRIYSELGRCRREQLLSDVELRVIDVELRLLLDVCGGCERIRNTRIVRSYRVFAQQCIFLYLATLPWGIVESFRGWTILLATLSAYFMLGMETVAEHIEEPFGLDEDDLDLEALCQAIECSVEQVFTVSDDPRLKAS